MSDATGELSTTVIAIVAIAAILAVFTVFLLPTLRAQIALSQACTTGPDNTITNDKSEIICDPATQSNGKMTFKCHYTYTNDDGSTQTAEKTCTQ